MPTAEQLRAIMPNLGEARAKQYAPLLTAAMAAYDIKGYLREAAFLAQIGHESGQLRYTEEIASGAAYEGRKDLGNVVPGDGRKFKGRGLIQITGRANMAQAAKALNLDLLNKPELLSEPINATLSAAWWWHSRNLNALADARDFDRISRTINGGTKGKADRDALYFRALKVLYPKGPSVVVNGKDQTALLAPFSEEGRVWVAVRPYAKLIGLSFQILKDGKVSVGLLGPAIDFKNVDGVGYAKLVDLPRKSLSWDEEKQTASVILA